MEGESLVRGVYYTPKSVERMKLSELVEEILKITNESTYGWLDMDSVEAGKIQELLAESEVVKDVDFSVQIIERVKKQIEYHKEKEINRSKVKNYSRAIYHDNKRGALEDLLCWIELIEC